MLTACLVIATSTLGPMSYPYPSNDYWLPIYNFTLPYKHINHSSSRNPELNNFLILNCRNGTVIKVPGANLSHDYYSSITTSMLTLFQVMTGDSWSSDILRSTMVTRPWSWILFIVFYSLFSFILLNVFTGIIVDAIQSYEQQQSETRKGKPTDSKIKHGRGREKSRCESVETTATDSSDKDVLQSEANKDGVSILKSSFMKSDWRRSSTYERDRFASVATIESGVLPLRSLPAASATEQSASGSNPLILRELQALNEEMTTMQSKIMTRIAVLESKIDSFRL